MNTHTVRIVSAMMLAVVLLVVGTVLWSHSGSTASVAPATVTTAHVSQLSADQARIIAQDTKPHAVIVGDPTLTTYQGAVAYAVPMDTWTIYVDVTSGRTWWNPATMGQSGTNG